MTQKTKRERELSNLKKADLVERLIALENREPNQSHEDSDLPIRQLLDVSPSAAVISDGERIIAINKEALRIYRADSLDDFSNIDVRDLIHPQDREDYDARQNRGLRDRKTSPIVERRCLALDGTELILESSIVPIMWQGKPVTLSFQNDITDRNNREVVYQRLARIFETSVDAIIGTTLDGIVTDWNVAVESL